MKPSTLLFALLVTQSAYAEPLYITIPGEGAAVKVNAPPMTNTRGSAEGRRFRYMASSPETGVTISLYTETVGAASAEVCRETYWSKGQAAPIQRSDVKLFESPNAAFVTHRSEAVFQGTTHKTANGHAYFVRNGLCMDFHVSHWPYKAGSEARVAEVLQSLVVVE